MYYFALFISLGYKVADIVETGEDLCFEWQDFLDGKTSIKPVIYKYKYCCYQANQDMPSNLYWEGKLRISFNKRLLFLIISGKYFDFLFKIFIELLRMQS